MLHFQSRQIDHTKLYIYVNKLTFTGSKVVSIPFGSLRVRQICFRLFVERLFALGPQLFVKDAQRLLALRVVRFYTTRQKVQVNHHQIMLKYSKVCKFLLQFQHNTRTNVEDKQLLQDHSDVRRYLSQTNSVNLYSQINTASIQIKLSLN